MVVGKRQDTNIFVIVPLCKLRRAGLWFIICMLRLRTLLTEDPNCPQMILRVWAIRPVLLLTAVWPLSSLSIETVVAILIFVTDHMVHLVRRRRRESWVCLKFAKIQKMAGNMPCWETMKRLRFIIKEFYSKFRNFWQQLRIRLESRNGNRYVSDMTWMKMLPLSTCVGVDGIERINNMSWLLTVYMSKNDVFSAVSLTKSFKLIVTISPWCLTFYRYDKRLHKNLKMWKILAAHWPVSKPITCDLHTQY